ncbi:MAG TPA: cytochrome c oxidase subunit II [Thermoanaerobaculia bacterium]|nr:cytochrome c oxidase subunit II [Thermoanaerobaculia bacterium]
MIPLLAATYQSALHPAGKYAAEIKWLLTVFTIVASVVFVLTFGFFVVSLIRGRRNRMPDATDETARRSAKWVGGALGVTIVALFILLFASVVTGRALSHIYEPTERHVSVIGHQWWWEVSYDGPQADQIVLTANELHLPVGERVIVHLTSRDVIHSLWIPNLNGKRDLIPGKESTIAFQADKPGIYRAQCAEFCGMQHAMMGLVVVAEPKEKFDGWLAAQRMPSRSPVSIDEQKGQQIFMNTSCAMCHSIKGTSAGARTGPDLTHIGSRRTLAAGVISNTRGNLAGWVADAGGIKPGVLMPPNSLTPDELNALVVYLESLK